MEAKFEKSAGVVILSMYFFRVRDNVIFRGSRLINWQTSVCVPAILCVRTGHGYPETIRTFSSVQLTRWYALVQGLEQPTASSRLA